MNRLPPPLPTCTSSSISLLSLLGLTLFVFVFATLSEDVTPIVQQARVLVVESASNGQVTPLH